MGDYNNYITEETQRKIDSLSCSHSWSIKLTHMREMSTWIKTTQTHKIISIFKTNSCQRTFEQCCVTTVATTASPVDPCNYLSKFTAYLYLCFHFSHFDRKQQTSLLKYPTVLMGFKQGVFSSQNNHLNKSSTVALWGMKHNLLFLLEMLHGISWMHHMFTHRGASKTAAY